MSHLPTLIDLTGDSDDEYRNRNQGVTARPRNQPQGNFLHTRPHSFNYRHPLSVPSLRFNPFSAHVQRNPPPLHPADPGLHLNAPQNHHHFLPSPNYRHGVEAEGTIMSEPRVAPPPPPLAAPKPHASTRMCVNCAEVGVTCDGERPCSACVEPGLSCYYPGDVKISNADQDISLRLAKSDHGGFVTTKDTNASASPARDLPSQVDPPSRSLSDKSSHLDSAQTRLLNHLAAQRAQARRDSASEGREAIYESNESDDEDVPLAIGEFEDVRNLLKAHETRMKDHRAYLVQPLLNQSKRDASKMQGPTGKKKSQMNPFANLVAQADRTLDSGSRRPVTVQMQVKSNKPGAPKKWCTISVPLKTVDADSTILPKYKSIGRLGMSLLAPNIRTLKYWPYFPDEENLDPSEAKKNEELEERYQHDDNHLLAQRKCSELADMWRPWVKDFVSKLRIEFSDILYWFLHTTEKTLCDTCERDILVDAFIDIARLIPKPTERSLSLARLSTMALKEVAKVSMWHFVLEAPSVKDLIKQVESSREMATTLCSICFLHNCLSHGAFLEPEESGGAVIMGGNIEINDEETNHNVLLSVAVPNRDREGEHQCGLYCVAAEARIKDVLGQRKDGTIGGIYNHAIHVSRPSYANDVSCGKQCYWLAEKRTRFGTVSQTKDYQPRLSEKWKQVFKKLLRIHCDNQRVPCMLAREISDLTCMDAFYCILAESQRVSHYRQAAVNIIQHGPKKLSKQAAGLDTSLSAELDERPPFVPCSHTGPCLNNADCTCARDKVHCEWFCGCGSTCDRRFPGCKCASANKTCFDDKSCECWRHNRECDPWLCGGCGVTEVLDPQNKYDDNIRQGRCKNNRIQLELPARTIKAPSEVQGWGLYAGVDLDEDTFIGEYKGETVGNQESDRRGAVYANIGQEYLFVMNRDQQIDGSNFGNKTRFINNSQREDYINVYAKKLLCNGVQRVMLYAKKPIRAGEELLYNYNYPVSVTKKFWERGEGPMSMSGAVVAKPSITWTHPPVNGRHAKVAGNQDSEQSLPARSALGQNFDAEVEESAGRRDTKRKRALGESGAAAMIAHDLVSESEIRPGASARSQFVSQDDRDDSDFEFVDGSGSSGSVDEADVVRPETTEAPPSTTATTTTRKQHSIVPLHDRRRGGLAQAKAWETRRKRNAKVK